MTGPSPPSRRTSPCLRGGPGCGRSSTPTWSRSRRARRHRGRSGPDAPPRGLAPDLLVDLYVAMRRIRRVEETIAALYPEQEIRCPTHLSLSLIHISEPT